MPDYEQQAFLIENLRKYRTLAGLKKSDFFASHAKRIDQCLNTPELQPFSGAAPLLDSFLRVTQWNIEKGKRFEAILELLRTDGVLRWADIIILNEADCGMNRSQNRHVALELAGDLGMHLLFAPVHFELTKGIDEELTMDGENRVGMQGNAILSRYPIREACIVPLPITFEPYEFSEKRYGRRCCAWARIQLRSRPIWVGSVHLELRNTPRCRARQMQYLLKHLPGGSEEAFILGGDLNCNTFSRGSLSRTLCAMLRLLLSSPPEVKSELLHPESIHEPLFRVVRQHGFSWEEFNSRQETARASLDTLEEAEFLPDAVKRVIWDRLNLYNGFLCFKLDWFFGKNVHALKLGQRRDSQKGVSSLDPACLGGNNGGPNRVSDHLPIYMDLDLT
jgi:endonuclease/exonuclease/phosphatase family metal-dependent hydrolase